MAQLAIQLPVCSVQTETCNIMLEGLGSPTGVAGRTLGTHFFIPLVLSMALLTGQGVVEPIQGPSCTAGVVKGLHRFGGVAPFTFVGGVAREAGGMKCFHRALGPDLPVCCCCGARLLLFMTAHTRLAAMTVCALQAKPAGVVVMEECYNTSFLAARFVHDTLGQRNLGMRLSCKLCLL